MLNEMMDKQDQDRLDEIRDHSLTLMKVLDKIYEQDSQFILTVLGTTFCTLGVHMYGTERFKRFLDQMHLQVDEMFATTEVEPDTEMSQHEADTIMTQVQNDTK